MPRNVLLIVADDLGKNLSCYGDPNVSTPHIDSLSARGTRFDRAFASTASCSGSRSTIYTGLHTHTNGQYGLNHKHHHFMTHDHIESLPKVFNDAGYLTGIIGKVHVGPDAVYPWTVKHEGWAGDRNVQAMSEAAGTFMDRARTEDKSWNLIVAFHDPHRDGTRDGFANRGDHPGVTDTLFDPAKIQVPDYLTDLPEVRAELAEYYRSISRFDQGVGMVLKKLQDSNQVDDTMVILVSDNGPPFVNSKTTMFDAGICLPLIAAVPGQSGGKTSLAMISFLDILPTCLDYCGITPPPNTTSPPRLGRSFVSLLDESGSPADWSAVYGSHTFHGIAEFYPTRYLRTPRYKYHRNVCWKLDFPFASDLFSSKAWAATRNSTKETKGEVMMGPRGLKQYIRRRPEELYDLESDPHEIHDLSRDEKHRDVLLDMREKMKVWQKESLDPWLWQDGASLLGLERYMEQDPTFTLPDRFDFDPEHPSTDEFGSIAFLAWEDGTLPTRGGHLVISQDSLISGIREARSVLCIGVDSETIVRDPDCTRPWRTEDGVTSNMQALKRGISLIRPQDDAERIRKERLVVAHFMLGNTYGWTQQDWEETIALAEDTCLDGFALNLGPDQWQYDQALLAMTSLDGRAPSAGSSRPFKAFLSLDMNVLPSSSEENGAKLVDMVLELMQHDGYLRYRGGPLLSTFGGHQASFGGWGWQGFLDRLNEKLGGRVFFMPAFFMPPKDFLELPYVDGTFAWNNAWPKGDHSVNVVEDEPFLESEKPYMAAVSPLFFTHYGTTGEWAFNKNFVYRSDDLLYPWRWQSLLSLPTSRSPQLVQVISWNDHGESHHVSPVRRNQPGSDEWTRDMPHEAFREMTRYFARRWRDGWGEVEEVARNEKRQGGCKVRAWGWWRCHPKDADVSDPVGRPEHAEWAQDLINLLVLVPETPDAFHLDIHNGDLPQHRHLESGKANLITIPFAPGPVSFEVVQGSTDVVLAARGREISSPVERYNFNMWSGCWEASIASKREVK